MLSPYYFCFWLPKNGKTGVALFQTVHGRGLKTLVSLSLQEKIEPKFGAAKLRIEPLTTGRVLNEWINSANIKQIKLTRYVGDGMAKDMADSLGETTTEVIIRPKGRDSSLGAMSDFWKKGRTAPDNAMFSQASAYCGSVKVIAELGGKRRTFSMRSANFAADIEFDENDVKMINGNPDITELRAFSRILIEDIKKGL